MWIDTHCHTKYSYDNWLEPVALIRRAKALGLDGIVITEHYSYEASAPVEAIAQGEGPGAWRRRLSGQALFLRGIAGQGANHPAAQPHGQRKHRTARG